MAGSEFAKRLLKKQGWKEGSGLGKQENGRADPVKVTLKMDKTGVGHDPGREFTDHWWLRVFNDAAQQIGQTNQKEPNEEDKRKEKKNNLYKGFVKSSTLANGVETSDKNSDSSDEETSVKTNTRVPTMEEIHQFCRGATGHRAAMFGIKMKGKLNRVAEQDSHFEKKFTNEKKFDEAEKTEIEIDVDAHVNKKSKKKKRCRSPLNVQSSTDQEIIENKDGGTGQKKKKRKEKEVCSESVSSDMSTYSTEKSGKKKHKIKDNSLDTSCQEKTVKKNKKR